MTKKSSRLPAVSVEHRSVKLDRSAAPADGRSFSGHAAVYNTRTAIGNPLQWGFYEQVAPGAFDKSLRDGDVVMLADHDPSKPIARMSAGTLALSSDGDGLAVSVPTVPNLSYGDDLLENVRVGNINGMSFGFQTVQDDWQVEQVETNDGNTADVEVRTLLEVRLIEVSTTPFPAYPTTDAGVRSVRAARQSSKARGQASASDRSPALLAALAGSVRVGATISAATLEQLQACADAIEQEDTDTAAAILNDLMSVEDGAGTEPDEDAAGEENAGFPVDLAIRWRELAETQGLTI